MYSILAILHTLVPSRPATRKSDAFIISHSFVFRNRGDIQPEDEWTLRSAAIKASQVINVHLEQNIRLAAAHPATEETNPLVILYKSVASFLLLRVHSSSGSFPFPVLLFGLLSVMADKHGLQRLLTPVMPSASMPDKSFKHLEPRYMEVVDHSFVSETL
jgi:hypothetical protein